MKIVQALLSSTCRKAYYEDVFVRAFISLALVSSFAFADQKQADKDVRLVRTESYSITRFQEVVESAMDDEPTSLKDRLIRLRAQLEIAKRDLEQLNQRNEVPDKDQHELYVRAAQAQVDHFRQLIARTERKALKKR